MLIGKMLSGLYLLLNGHIYFNNNVIKIRYDLLESDKDSKLTEHDYFDYFFDIFEIKNNLQMNSISPLDSMRSHRMAYIKNDKLFSREPIQIIIVPYLHERRVYLNREDPEVGSFYTTVGAH